MHFDRSALSSVQSRTSCAARYGTTSSKSFITSAFDSTITTGNRYTASLPAGYVTSRYADAAAATATATAIANANANAATADTNTYAPATR